MHLVRIGRSPAHLADMMTATADLPDRERLRSASNFRYEIPQLKLKFRIRWTEGLELSSIQSTGTLILSKNNWKLTYSSSPMNDEYDFVDAMMHHWSL